MEDILTMSQEELKRLHIIRKVIDKRIKQREAADLLELSQRQIRRLVRRVRQESDKGIIHRSRGKDSHRALSLGLKQKVLGLCRSIYAGFNPTLASEKLFEKNKIKLSRETLRQWFIAEGLAYDKRKARPHRKWRPRKAHCGAMLQMDGSHHDWFESRGPECVLMGYIDDATNRAYARFYEYEGTFPAMDSLSRYILKYGLPISVYFDRHSTYKSTKKDTIEDELLNRQALSQFARALEELGVHFIHAQSAPAKGRIERLFKTLQDRLVKEMRLKGIKSIAEGNRFLERYLPVFNRRFGVEALNSQDLHRPLIPGADLSRIFTIRTERALRNDFTIRHKGKLYQIEDNIRSDRVVVEDCLNGRRLITYKGRTLRYKEILQHPPKKVELRKIHKPNIPAWDHPWRNRVPADYALLNNKEETLARAL